MVVGAAEQGREHLLQTGDEVIGFPRAFGQVLYLFIFDRKFPAQKYDLPVLLAEAFFKLCGIVSPCRVMSRQVGACRRTRSRLAFIFPVGTGCRDRSVLVAACRTSSMYAMCLSTDVGAIRYFSPNSVSMRRHWRWPLAQ